MSDFLVFDMNGLSAAAPCRQRPGMHHGFDGNERAFMSENPGLARTCAGVTR